MTLNTSVRRTRQHMRRTLCVCDRICCCCCGSSMHAFIRFASYFGGMLFFFSWDVTTDFDFDFDFGYFPEIFWFQPKFNCKRLNLEVDCARIEIEFIYEKKIQIVAESTRSFQPLCEMPKQKVSFKWFLFINTLHTNLTTISMKLTHFFHTFELLK